MGGICRNAVTADSWKAQGVNLVAPTRHFCGIIRKSKMIFIARQTEEAETNTSDGITAANKEGLARATAKRSAKDMA